MNVLQMALVSDSQAPEVERGEVTHEENRKEGERVAKSFEYFLNQFVGNTLHPPKNGEPALFENDHIFHYANK